MTPRSLGLFVKKLQPKVGLGRYDILFAYFVVEAKSKTVLEIKNPSPLGSTTIIYLIFLVKFFCKNTFDSAGENHIIHFMGLHVVLLFASTTK